MSKIDDEESIALPAAIAAPADDRAKDGRMVAMWTVNVCWHDSILTTIDSPGSERRGQEYFGRHAPITTALAGIQAVQQSELPQALSERLYKRPGWQCISPTDRNISRPSAGGAQGSCAASVALDILPCTYTYKERRIRFDFPVNVPVKICPTAQGIQPLPTGWTCAAEVRT